MQPARLYETRAQHQRSVDLGFELPAAKGSLLAAFLVIPPGRAAAEPGRVLQFEVRLLVDPWPDTAPDPAAKASPQRAGIGAAYATATEGAVARLEVTGLLDRWLQRPSAGYGLRMTATEASGRALSDAELSAPAYLELYTDAESAPGGNE